MDDQQQQQQKTIALISIRLYVFLVSCAFCFIFILPFWLTKELNVGESEQTDQWVCARVYGWKTALRGTTLET